MFCSDYRFSSQAQPDNLHGRTRNAGHRSQPYPTRVRSLLQPGHAYSLSGYPIGVLSDRVNRLTLLAIGLVLLLLADLVLAFATDFAWLGIGVVLWGLHMGFTQGLLTTLIAETAPAELRGTAFGMFNLMTGVALLIASVVAGALWDAAGPEGTFLAGAAFTVLTLAGLFVIRGRLRGRADA
jgi:MFS family permease